MFNSLTGTITGKFPQKLLIDTHGIEWEVNVPDSCLDEFSALGEEGKVFVWLQHTDVLMNLYGFATQSERQLFFDFLKVDGIGPKAALKIMGNIGAQELVEILEKGDLDSLQKVPGVGKKTAAKMLLQLKGKLKFDEKSSNLSQKVSLPYEAVLDALVDMGYDRKICEIVLARLADELKADSDFAGKTSSEKEDFIFRRAIVEMSK